MEWEEFERNVMLQDAVIRQLSVIGEAARNVAQETKAAQAEIPWIAMIGRRNRLVHEYSRINLTRVWDTVQINIPRLISSVAPLVPLDERESRTTGSHEDCDQLAEDRGAMIDAPRSALLQ